MADDIQLSSHKRKYEDEDGIRTSSAVSSWFASSCPPHHLLPFDAPWNTCLLRKIILIYVSSWVNKSQILKSTWVHPKNLATYGYSGTRKKIEIPNSKVGVIIGKGGETIRYLQLQYGVKIKVTRDAGADPSSQTRMVELMGTSEQIERVEQLINDVLREVEAEGSVTVTNRNFVGVRTGSE